MRFSSKVLVTALTGAMLAGTARAQNEVQVYILAGQSNMQGHGRVEVGNGGVIGAEGSLRYQVNNDPANYGHLGDGAGTWYDAPDTYIYTTDGARSGALTAGFGVTSDYSRIGPELGFGWEVQSVVSQDVLIIKTCWGGQSLYSDFRPPTAVRDRGGEVGQRYNDILSTVDNVLSNIGTYVPGYAGQGYQLAGFGWHQGWNDRINATAVAEYEENMLDFINDIRFDLGASDLPFVIANTGIGGYPLSGDALTLANAQLGPGNVTLAANQIDLDPEVLYPDLSGNVSGVNTIDYWRDASVSPLNQNYHWNGNGESYYLIGEAMGQAMASMVGYTQFERAYLTVNQQTGEITLFNPSTNIADMDLESYTITSPSGALDAVDWTSIAGNYDGSGDSSVDSGNWAVGTGGTGELTESADLGGADGLITIGNQISLGNAWIQNLNKDLVATYTDTDGNVIELNIRYLGFDNILADLTTDGIMNVNDWAQFVSGMQTDMSSLSAAQAYQLGDLDGDFDNDIDDFDIFRQQYEALNPEPGAFEAMLAEYAVPEPSSLAMLGLGLAGLCMRRRREPRGRGVEPGSRDRETVARRKGLNKPSTRVLLGATTAALITATASAELLVYEPFIYGNGTSLIGEAGGVGFAQPWAAAQLGGSPTVYNETGIWDGVVNNVPTSPTPGASYISTPTIDYLTAQRELGQSAGALAGGDNVLWASVVWRMTGNNYGRQIGFVLGTDGLRNRSQNVDTSGSFGSGAGDAIGVGGAINTRDVTPVIFDNGGIATRTTTGASQVSYTLENLVVLKYTFADGATPDTVSAYTFTENATLLESTFNTNAISASAVIDQNALNILSFSQTNRGGEAIDEIRLGDTFADVISGIILPPQISLRVNTTNGVMEIIGDDTGPVELNYYQVTSAGDSLNPTGWDSLADQDFDGNGPPSGFGNGWEEASGSDTGVLAEGYLLGNSTVSVDQVVSLGTSYDEAIDARDLEMRFRIDTGQIFDADIAYFSPLVGDADNNGMVEFADFVILSNNYNGASTGQRWGQGDFDGDGDVAFSDFVLLSNNWGASAAELASAMQTIEGYESVPEPASAMLLGLGGLMIARRRRS